jgi:hypothetical protein
MKRIFIISILAFLSLVSCINKDNLVGNWDLLVLEEDEKSYLEADKGNMVFEEDGFFLMNDGEFSNRGTWSIDKKSKSIVLDFFDGGIYSDDEILKDGRYTLIKDSLIIKGQNGGDFTRLILKKIE